MLNACIWPEFKENVGIQIGHTLSIWDWVKAGRGFCNIVFGHTHLIDMQANTFGIFGGSVALDVYRDSDHATNMVQVKNQKKSLGRLSFLPKNVYTLQKRKQQIWDGFFDGVLEEEIRSGPKKC